MHKSARLPGVGVQLVRAAHVLTFASALAALTGFVVADVLAADAEPPTAMRIADAPEPDPIVGAPAPQLLAMTIVVPDAAVPVPDPPEVPAPKKKKARKIKFGRFDAY